MSIRDRIARILLAPASDIVPIKPKATTFAELGIDDYIGLLQDRGFLFTQTLQPTVERIENDFPGLVAAAYKSNTAVFALELVRILLFSEARFLFRQQRNGKPGALFGTQALSLLETPWQNATTGDLLTRALLYADLAGNAYGIRRPIGPTIKLPRPDWMTIIIGSPNPNAPDDPWDIDNELVGYQYHPGGIGNGTPISFLPEEVAHFAPLPDPIARYRGMSWMTPVIREIEADTAATAHKLAYFRNGATVNQVVKVDNPLIKTPQDFNNWIDMFEADHRGATNAYRTLYLLGGTDVTAVGSNLEQADFKVTQGAGESRLAAAAGVPAAIVGFSEGLQGSALATGNYNAAKRRLADGTMRPLWRNFCGSFQTIVPPPAGADLWYDASGIPFLAEDAKDAADVIFVQSQSIRQLTDGGYDPNDVVDGVVSGDLSRLQHTGLLPVQLQQPGAATMTAQSMRAHTTFWTAGSDESVTVAAGLLLPLDSPWVRRYPAMFEPSLEEPLAIPVVSFSGVHWEPPMRPQLVADVPIPVAAASPAPVVASNEPVRCGSCGKMLAKRATPPYGIECYRCKAVAEATGLEPPKASGGEIVIVTGPDGEVRVSEVAA